MERVHELMTPVADGVGSDTPLSRCAAIFAEEGARALPVVDGDEVVGLLTDASVFGRGRFDGERWEFGDLSAGASMLPAFVLSASEPASKAIRKLVGRGAAIVVDDDRRLCGLLSEHEAVRLAPTHLPAFRRVGEIASRPVDTIDASRPVREAWEHLRSTGRRHLVVVDPRGAAIDVVSLRDLVRAGIQPDDARTVSQVCPQPRVHAISERTSVQEAARRMAEMHVGCLPSVDDAGAPVCILTRTDILRLLADTLEDEALFGQTADRNDLFQLVRRLRGEEPMAALEALRDRLPNHFAAEERAGGLFERLCARGCEEEIVEGFRFQHAALAEALAELTRSDPTDPAWTRRAIRFANQLEAHEFEESRAALRAQVGSAPTG